MGRQFLAAAAAASIVLGATLAPAFADDVEGTPGADVLTGSFLPSVINALGGDDIVFGDPVASPVILSVERLNVPASGGEASGGDSFRPVVSPDGTMVAFDSLAGNLVSGDGNLASDVFVRNIVTGTTTLVSAAANGTIGDATSRYGVFSPDSRQIAFESDAANLVPGDANQVRDIFLKTLATGAVVRISVAADGTEANGPSWGPVDIAQDGRVLFVSDASNLVPGDTNGAPDLFIKNPASGAITRVSTTAAGAELPSGVRRGPLWNARFDRPGGRIIFVSADDTLVPNDTNEVPDVFVKTLSTGAVTRVSTDSSGGQTSPFGSRFPLFSPDGKSVAFIANDTTLLCCDDGSDDLFLKNLETGIVTRVSTDEDGGDVPHAVIQEPTFTPDGVRLTFVSAVRQPVRSPRDFRTIADVHLKDIESGIVFAFSVGLNAVDGNGDSGSGRVNFTPDGLGAVFSSLSDNFVQGDTNAVSDIFLIRVAEAPGSPDQIDAGDGDDVVYGVAGDDFIFGGRGNDFLVGMSGTDTVIYTGPRHRYDIVETAPGIFRVTDLLPGSPEGTDTVTTIELAKFGAAPPLPWNQLPPPNRAPRLPAPVALVTTEDVPFEGRLEPIDPDGDVLLFEVVAEPGNGTLDLDVETGSFVYTPNGNGRRTDSFRVIARDFLGASVVIPVSIRINGLRLVGSPRPDDLVGTDAPDVLFGRGGDDTLFGGRSRDRLLGEAGDDTLDGGPGRDFMAGGPGDDVYVVDNPGDQVVEQPNQGFDTVETSVSFRLPDNVEAGVLTGRRPLVLTGNALDNRLTGNDGPNQLFGEGGDDVFVSSAGADRNDGSAGFDTLDYSPSPQAVRIDIGRGRAAGGHAQGDRNTGMDGVIGSRFDDTLTGDPGVNLITGGRGADRLRGGTAADDFIYLSVEDSTPARPDIILDLSIPEKDRVDLSAIDANATTPGINDAFTFIGGRAFSGRPGEVRFARGRLEANVNADRVADLVIRITVRGGSFGAANLVP